MIYNTDYLKLKKLGSDNYNNSLGNPNQERIATLGINNYTDDDCIYNMEETLCMFTMKINEIIDMLNGLPDYEEILRLLKIILEYLKDIDLANYYTKPEIDAMFANIKDMILNIDLSDYYTKAEIDAIIAGLEFTVDAFTKAETRAFYTQSNSFSIYQYYLNQEISQQSCILDKNLLHFNFRVDKIDETGFNKYQKIFIGYSEYLPKFTTNIINAVGRGYSVDEYVIPCTVVLSNLGTMYVSCSDNVRSIIVSGTVIAEGTYDNNLIFNPINLGTPPAPLPPIDFIVKTPNQIRDDLLTNYGYVEIEQTSFNSKLTKNDLVVNFTKLGEQYDKYELNNELSLISNIDEMKRILNYTFTYDTVEYIMSKQQPGNPNWINLDIDNKIVALFDSTQINVQY